jgi:hypothetical protein
MPHVSESIEALRNGWVNAARAQGLVCLVCLEVPPLEDRDAYFDTGLCAHCAEDLSRGERVAGV